MIKTMAGFLMNVVDPMLDKLVDVLKMASAKGLDINKESLKELIGELAKIQIKTIIVQGIFYFAMTGLICWTIYKCMM